MPQLATLVALVSLGIGSDASDVTGWGRYEVTGDDSDVKVDGIVLQR